MPGLILWKNEEINKLKRDMDRLFSRMWDDFGIRLSPSGLGTILDMSETEDLLVIQAELPEVDPTDLEVSLADDLLTIKWNIWEEIFEEKRQRFFSRTFRLPCKVEADQVEATYKGGVLTIALPKCRTEPPREVKIRIQQE
jgi:HSP20 family protein